jgi:sn-glycerol 3-phosphate transport system permease protein
MATETPTTTDRADRTGSETGLPTDLFPSGLGVHAALVGSILLMASPLLLALVMSTQSIGEVYDVTFLGLGSEGLSNYVEVLTTYELARYMVNSLVMSVIIVVGKLAVSLLAAMALVYYDFRYKNAVFFFILFTLMFPVPVRIVPLFELMVDLGWANTLLALTGPYVASATAVFLLRQHFQTIPTSLVESAQLDGVGPVTFLRRVLVPMSRGMLTGLAVIEFIYAWNQYLWPLIVINDQRKQVVQVGMKYLQSVGTAGQTDWALIMAGAVLTLLPPLVVLVAFRGPLLTTLGLHQK